MLSTSAPLILSALLPALTAAETVVGVYMFHRHGDRTAKSTPPTALTDLGYSQVYTSGNYYRNRYITSDATYPIAGISNSLVVESQLAVSAPADDNVLQNSAMGFLQGLYPPVGSAMGSSMLRNGSSVEAPLNGYQLIPVQTVTSGTNSENTGWLQASTGCNNAETSSNEYFYSDSYNSLYASTMDFYQTLDPVVNGTFNASATNYKNAYTIFDLINVASIHNVTYNASDLITTDVFHQLLTLANTHEFSLAYNSSSTIRAIAGMQIAAEAVDFLNSTITGKGASKMGIQFGAYGTFLSFFGLADLTKANPDFYGITDYASSMVFELYTNADSADPFPTADELNVRFLFHNGTANSTSPPVQYPLFGGDALNVSWNDFTTNMGKFSVGTTEQWCIACGNTTGQCAPYASEVTSSGSGSDSGSDSSSGNGSGLSNAVCGVIGAMVTLGVILLVEAAILLFGGFTLVSKKRLANGRAVANGNGMAKA